MGVEIRLWAYLYATLPGSFLLADSFMDAPEGSLMLSFEALLVDVLGAGLSGEFGSVSVGLITVGVMVDRFGFGVADGVEAKDLRTWAANSPRVAGKGRPGPTLRCSGAVVGGAGSAGGWDWGGGVMGGCGALCCAGTDLLRTDGLRGRRGLRSKHGFPSRDAFVGSRCGGWGR